jgi:hypothetical protein
MTTRSPYEDALRAEIAAIRRIIDALDSVDPPTQERILRYLVDRYATPKDAT